MSKHPCRDAFDAAQAFREQVPLPAGRYKLEQALWELGRMRTNVELSSRIVRKQDAKDAKAALAGCAPEERGTYLKRIPRDVANILGRLILPGTAELHADGLTKAETQRRFRSAQTRTMALLTECEGVHHRLRQGIRHEYDAMKAGRSYLLPLIDAAESIAHDGLRSVRVWS